MNAHRRLDARSLFVMLGIVGLSALACSNPERVADDITSGPKLSPEEMEEGEQGHYEDDPQLGEQADAAPADAAPLAQAEPEDVSERECEQDGRPNACLRFAHEALESRDGARMARGAMALSYACELNNGRGCYEYALVTWWGVGVAYQASEVEYGFKRARELGEPMAQRGYASLTKGQAPGALGADNDTIFHQSHACSLGIAPACGAPPEDLRTETPPRPATPAVRGPRPQPLPEPPKVVEAPKVAEPVPEPPKVVEPPKVAALKGKHRALDLKVSGGLSKESAQRTITQESRSLTACYEEGLALDARLEGAITAQIGVDEGGQVRGVNLGQSKLASEAVRACMTQAIQQWRFDPSQNNMTSLVVYQAEFTRAAAR
jgi:hypothetical protein